MRQANSSDAAAASLAQAGERTARPDVYLYRGRAGDGAECLVTFDRRTVVIARKVGGLPCRVRLGMGCFDAVAVRDRSSRHVVSLWHSDPSLSVDLAEFATFDEAEAHCVALMGFTGLAPLVLSGFGCEDSDETGALTPAPRRKRTSGERRPRFLKRRESGQVIQLRPIAGRELTARN